MVSGTGEAILGTMAATCTTVAFVPQIQKILKTGGKDASYPMLILYLVGVSLWLSYGIVLGAAALSLANAASILFVGACLSLKLVKERQARRMQRNERRRLRIAIDMDGTIANSVKEQIRRFNGAFGANLTEADLLGKNLEDLVPADQRTAVRRLVRNESFFEHLEVMEGAQEVAQELASQHDLFIVSAAMEIPESFAAKYRWLQRHFPFIPAANVVFCGDKKIVDADYLIDDEPRHFRGFRGIGILFSAPHNAKESGYSRVENWQEVRRLFLQGHTNAEEPQERAPQGNRVCASPVG